MPSSQAHSGSATKPKEKWGGFLAYAKRTWGKLNHYQRGVVVTLLLVGGILCVSMVFLPDLLQTDDFALFAYTFTAFIGGPISGSTYLSRSFDFRGKWEKILTPIMSFGGLLVGIALLATRIFTPPVGHAATVMVRIGAFLLSQVSIYGGMGNRFGSLLDSDPNNPKQRSIWEKRFMFTVVCGMAIFLSFATGFAHAALVTAIKTTTILSAGAALPVWMLVLSSVGLTSMSYSMGDYLSKTTSYLRVNLPKIFTFLPQPSEQLRQCVAVDREHEYRGAAVGTLLGIGIGIGLIVALTIFAPHVVGTAAVFTGIFLMVMSVSTGGGLGSRVGHLVDGLTNAKDVDGQAAEKDKLKPGAEPGLSHDHDNDPRSGPSLVLNSTYIRATEAGISASSPPVVPISSVGNIQDTTTTKLRRTFRRTFSCPAIVKQYKNAEEKKPAPQIIKQKSMPVGLWSKKQEIASPLVPETNVQSRLNL